MTPQELLKPRYKVIADWPGSRISVGEILYKFFAPSCGDYWARTDSEDVIVYVPEEFPHLFKPLQWWEERKESDMPQYVKCSETPLKGTVAKVIEWRGGVNSLECRLEKYSGAYNPGEYKLEPATEAEYLQQKSITK